MPRLVETKHIKHRILRVENGAFFCCLKIYISSALRRCAGGLFFFVVGLFGPAAFFISLSRGRVAAGVKQKPKKGATYGQQKYESRHRRKCRFGSYAQPPARARVRVREESADFTAWRVKTFGGDFDPVREAVEDAVAEFSDRQPARDQSLWLKIANKIGYEAFRYLYLDSWRDRPFKRQRASYALYGWGYGKWMG